VITNSDRTAVYFYLNDEDDPYQTTLKDARVVLKISKLSKFEWYRAYGYARRLDTTVYGYLNTLKAITHGY
jgi:hypothetical protein